MLGLVWLVVCRIHETPHSIRNSNRIIPHTLAQTHTSESTSERMRENIAPLTNFTKIILKQERK